MGPAGGSELSLGSTLVLLLFYSEIITEGFKSRVGKTGRQGWVVLRAIPPKQVLVPLSGTMKS